MTKKLQALFKPLKIGTLTLRNNLIAAPMAGLSSLPYRMLAMECGCGLAISEMVSAEGVVRAQKRTRRYFENNKCVRPFGLQIFGADPSAISEAICELKHEPIDLIDINMGCPVKKVVSKGAGSALMRTPKLASQIIKAARSATNLPLTVKIRAGWDDESINCVEISRVAEVFGADAVTIHPRTRMQQFKGSSDWRLIAKVKSKIKIPVIGNGDVHTRDDAIRMLTETGCDGIMIGRAAVGNPWIFAQILRKENALPTPIERGKTAVRHLQLLKSFLDERTAVLNMRAILPWYGKGLRGIRRLTQCCNQITTASDLATEIEKFFSSLHQASE